MTSPFSSSRRDFVLQSAGALTAVALLPDLGLAARFQPAQPVSLALIGCGRQGRAMISEISSIENVKITGVCDTDQARRDNAAKLASGAEAFADHNALLDKLKDVSGVIIATPTHLHKQIALDCIQAGKNVYCEAPLAHTIDDCRAIATAAASAKAVFAVGLEGRSNPVYKLARTFFRSDAVRDFVGAECQIFQKTEWKFPASDAARTKLVNWRLDPEVSTGLLGELGVQQIDVVGWYTGLEPVEISGRGAIRRWDDGRTIPDTVHCDFAFENKTVNSLNLSLANSYGGKFEVLRGTNAAVKLAWSHGWMFKESDAPTQGWEVYANRQQFHKDEGITLIADATKLAEQGKLKEGVGLPHTPLWYALADFIKSITESKPVGCDAPTGARATILAILANQAITTSKPVKVDPAQLRF
jgi:predicted dehydrogenase